MKLRVAMGILALAAGVWAQPAQQKGRAAVRVLAAPGSYLGINAAEVTAERAKALNLKEERGVEVTSVTEDSPAAKAGLKTGDVVLEFNGQPVQGVEQLTRMVRETPAGRQVKLGIWRGGAGQTVTATVATSKGTLAELAPGATEWTIPDLKARIPDFELAMPNLEIPRFQMSVANPRLGILGESVASQEQFAEFLGVKDGVLVKSVVKDSPAERAGVKAGDVIVKIDGNKVSSTEEITRVLRGLGAGRNSQVTLVRNKKEMTVSVAFDRPGRSIKAELPVWDC